MNAVVIERTWQRTTNLQEMRSRRTHKPEPIKVDTTYRTTHLTGCPRSEGGTVVAEGTVEEMLDLEPWPCDCVMENRVDNVPEFVAPAIHNPPSAKQIAFARSLGATDEQIEGLDRKAASTLIDALLAAPKTPAPAAASSVDVPAGLEILDRSNKYGGKCELCGGRVADGAGRLAKRNGKFAVVHRDGECVERTEAPAPAAAPRSDVPSGHYAIPSTGTNDLVFYKVKAPTEGKWAGRVFVDMVVGGHDDQSVRRDAVAGILDRIVAAGVEHSARLYGQEIGRCCRCNRTLTDEESRRNGIGPECATKGF